MRDKGIFITLEGGEGAGKTTQISEIEKYFHSKGLKCVCTREPGGIPISESIRNIILDKKNTSMDGRTEALLYAAARRQHLVEKIIPSLQENKIVICDRFIDSSLAYQGYARDIGMEAVLNINEFAIDGYMPDLTIFLDINVGKGLERVKSRNGEINRLDLEEISFHSSVRQGFLKLLQLYPERIKKIDGSKAINEVTADIIKLLEECFF